MKPVICTKYNGLSNHYCCRKGRSTKYFQDHPGRLDHPEHIRAMYVAKANPARSYPDANRLGEALDKLDLLVVTEIVMTETAMKADYVLPGKTGFEEYQWTIFQGNPEFIACRLKHPILEQIGEREASANILLEIMRAAGYIPEMPEKIYRAAEKSVEERDALSRPLDGKYDVIRLMA